MFMIQFSELQRRIEGGYNIGEVRQGNSVVVHIVGAHAL